VLTNRKERESKFKNLREKSVFFQASRAATGTFLSRVSGLVRDVLIAYSFGATYQYDAYVVAISIPFILRAIFAEGALSSAFIPIYARVENKSAFATKVMSFLILSATSTSILLIVFAPQIVYVFATGLTKNSVTFRDAVLLERTVAFFVLFISLWSWGAGMLNSHGSFFVPSLSPMFNNFGIIVGVLFSPLFHPPILSVAIGFVAGGAAQFIFEIPYLKKLGFKITPSTEWEPRNEFLRSFFFTTLSVALGNINFFVDINIASRLAVGTISVLQYANRIYQLPMGILVISLATVYLPKMAKRKDISSLRESIHDSFSKVLFVAIPSTAFVALFSKAIIATLFAHGAFGVQALNLTSNVLIFYILGFPFQSAVIVMSRALYAFREVKKAALVTMFGVGVNVTGDIFLGFRFGAVGLAAATTLASTASFFFLYILERHLYGIKFSTIWIEASKILIATAFASIISLTAFLLENQFLSLILGFTLFILPLFAILFLFKSENILATATLLGSKRKEESKNL